MSFESETANGRNYCLLIESCFVISQLPYVDGNQESNQVNVDSVAIINIILLLFCLNIVTHDFPFN